VLKAEWADRLHEHFSQLQLDVLPTAGHFVHLDQPEIAAEEIGSQTFIGATHDGMGRL
jgi:pimeloyl-ACP methyl ester carboxylesterase